MNTFKRKGNQKFIGQLGEDLALSYLLNHGYRFIGRHFFRKWGEIDLIVYDRKTKELVFVEVKTTYQKNNEERDEKAPEWHLNNQKIKRLKKAVLSYLNQNPQWAKKRWRFDFLALVLDDTLNLKEVRHWDSLPFYY